MVAQREPTKSIGSAAAAMSQLGTLTAQVSLRKHPNAKSRCYSTGCRVAAMSGLAGESATGALVIFGSASV